LQSKESISVVIPTYNRANDLLAAVESVLKQEEPVLEVLVCDDGSTDNSRELIMQLNHPAVIWLDCGKNGRPAIPRNTGIEKSNGNWIAFLDSDDSWTPEKTKRQLAFARERNLKAVCSNASRVRNGTHEGAYVHYEKPVITLRDLMVQNSVICSSVMIRKEVLLGTSLFPTDRKLVAEDYALWLRIATKADFGFLNENLVNYTDHFETSVRSEYKGDAWDMFKVIFADFKEWMKKEKVVLSREDKQALKKHLKVIDQKGIPTASEEFFRKLRDKLGIKN
jgi:glycosyltransferase involved in cell wall biosynthesis